MSNIKLEEKIKRDWFENHVAEFEKLNDDIKVLKWYEPGTSMYSIRYIFDGNKLYISGDLDSAVFEFTMPISHPSVFNKTNIGSFHKNMAAFHSDCKWVFNSELAVKELTERMNDENNEWSEEAKELFEIIITAAVMSDSVKDWIEIINYDFYDSITEKIDQDAWEWIYEIGNDYPPRVIGYLVGLKMAAKQLSKEKIDIGEQIKKLRIEKGFSLKDIEKLTDEKISESFLLKIEENKEGIKKEDLFLLADILDTEMSYFLLPEEAIKKLTEDELDFFNNKINSDFYVRFFNSEASIEDMVKIIQIAKQFDEGKI
ncbi:MAG: helix-turn-helix domain-containing protein [Candidatus Woesearchaeota archaeon]